MKLIVAGASGFVGTEVIRRSLSIRTITSVIALARKPVSTPANLLPESDATKLKSLVVTDYDQYTDNLRKELAGASACIWIVAITPSKASAIEWNEVKRVCQDCTMAGLKAMYEAGPGTPFRFLYMSGIAAERDQTKKTLWKPQYSLMRGETENMVMAFAAEHNGEVEASVAKPGLITSPGNFFRSALATAVNLVVSLPSADVGLLSAAMLDQVLNGIEKDPLTHADLERIGQKALRNTV